MKLVRPADHGEKLLDQKGATFELFNLRADKWWAKTHDDGPEILVCICDLNHIESGIFIGQ